MERVKAVLPVGGAGEEGDREQGPSVCMPGAVRSFSQRDFTETSQTPLRHALPAPPVHICEGTKLRGEVTPPESQDWELLWPGAQPGSADSRVLGHTP